MMASVLTAAQEQINSGAELQTLHDLVHMLPDNFEASGDTGKGSKGKGGCKDKKNQKVVTKWLQAWEKDLVSFAPSYKANARLLSHKNFLPRWKPLPAMRSSRVLRTWAPPTLPTWCSWPRGYELPTLRPCVRKRRPYSSPACRST